MKKKATRGRKSTWTKSEITLLNQYDAMRKNFRIKLEKVLAKLLKNRTRQVIYNKIYNMREGN